MHVSSTLLLHPIFFLPAVVLYVYNAWRPVLAGYQIEFEISSLPSPVVARRSRVEHWLDIFGAYAYIRGNRRPTLFLLLISTRANMNVVSTDRAYLDTYGLASRDALIELPYQVIT